jgi:hypothetical protein
VLEAVKKHVEIQSSERYRKERIAFFGFPVGTDYLTAGDKAENFNSRRLVAIYPDGAVIGLRDELGKEVEFIVDGSYIGAALIGVNVSPSIDVATSMTRKQIIGFKRLFRVLNEVEMDQTAWRGVTIIEDLDPIIRVRHSLTTDMSSPLTWQLHITTSADFVQQAMRRALDPYIGRKYLGNVNAAVEDTALAVMNNLVAAELINKVGPINAEQHPTDPTIMLLDVVYAPINALDYIRVTFRLRNRL